MACLFALLLTCLIGGCRTGHAPREDGRKVVFVAIDGADWRIIDEMIAAGGLPNIARMVQTGARGTLTGMPLFLSPALWTTMVTGVGPGEHGITDFVYEDAAGNQQMVTSNMRRRRAIWDILGERGHRVGIFGWLATWPAYPVNGHLVSSYGAYVLNREAPLEKLSRPLKGTFVAGLPDLTYPPAIEDEMRSLMVKPEDLTDAEIGRFADFSAAQPGSRAESLLDSIRFTYAADRAFAAMARTIYEREEPDFHTVYLSGVDVLSHRLWHFTFESPFSATAAERERFGRAIPEYYRHVDAEVGWYLERAGPHTTVVLASDHGFYGITRVPKGTYYSSGGHRMKGVLVMSGAGIEPGREIRNPSLFDIAPTLLAIFGLPKAADMRGRVLAEAFVDGYLEPIEPIETYETTAFGDEREGKRSAVDDAILERLRTLGYLDPDLPTAAR